MARHFGDRGLDFIVSDSICCWRLDFGCTAEKRKKEVGNRRTRLYTREMDVSFLRDCFFRWHTAAVRRCAVSRAFQSIISGYPCESDSYKTLRLFVMKEIVLSADGDSAVYSVPDVVADNLREYCIEFCDNWLWNCPDAKCFRNGPGVCYTEADFIGYLNKYLFPEQKSVLVKRLGWTNLGKNLPPEYRGLPCFNF